MARNPIFGNFPGFGAPKQSAQADDQLDDDVDYDDTNIDESEEDGDFDESELSPDDRTGNIADLIASVLGGDESDDLDEEDPEDDDDEDENDGNNDRNRNRNRNRNSRQRAPDDGDDEASVIQQMAETLTTNLTAVRTPEDFDFGALMSDDPKLQREAHSTLMRHSVAQAVQLVLPIMHAALTRVDKNMTRRLETTVRETRQGISTKQFLSQEIPLYNEVPKLRGFIETLNQQILKGGVKDPARRVARIKTLLAKSGMQSSGRQSNKTQRNSGFNSSGQMSEQDILDAYMPEPKVRTAKPKPKR